jgi:glycerol-3-phosphate cytidylyltransferase-like family protein
VDTRRKILTLAAAEGLRRPLVLVTGTFDILRAGHVRELADVRERTPGATLLAVVLPSPAAALDQRARAEMAAALRMVDYVVSADYGDVERLILKLEPAEVVRLESSHARLYAQLTEHVRRSQDR